MPPSRLAVILGPLIALVLIGGLVATVVQDPDRTELAQAPDAEQTFEPSEEPTADATVNPEATEPADILDTATPSPAATPSAAAPVPSEDAAPGAQPGVGGQVAVEDPTALTGGWQGGTPNTGTAISGAGLLLLLVGGAMLWARRPRG